MQLVPDAWQDLRAGPIWAFNPSLLRHGAGFLLAYRLVGADGRRRIGLCRLSGLFTVVPGSAVAYSDHIVFPSGSPAAEQARSWFADPRLFRLGDGVFIYWNSGWHEPANAQFIQQIDADSLRPIGPPRELVLDGPRRAIEKNWMLFESRGACYAVYSINPHRILSFSLQGSEAIVCRPVAATAWADESYQPAWGELRGGTPPQRSAAASTASVIRSMDRLAPMSTPPQPTASPPSFHLRPCRYPCGPSRSPFRRRCTAARRG
jgi:hypothetical protein